MHQVRVPIKKYQNITAIIAFVGFLLGLLIPLSAFVMEQWVCPFGKHVSQVTIFVLMTGAVGAVLLGNIAAVVVILIGKRRNLSLQSTKSRSK